MDKIRNFCIIAHIDHGKSTLADRMMEITGTVEKRDMQSQLLDSMDLEREKGITIKLAPVRMKYEYAIPEHKLAAVTASPTASARRDLRSPSSGDSAELASLRQSSNLPESGALNSRERPDVGSTITATPEDSEARGDSRALGGGAETSDLLRGEAEGLGPSYELNLIDTPGHVDFSYEVSRSLQACEGAVLVVDASQGIQAQTLANVYLAMEQDLVIIPVLNKVDLPAADVPRVSKEVMNLLGCGEDEIIKISAKTGENVDQVLSAIVERVPAPTGQTDDPTRALIFDSYYDDYRGVILYVRVVDGQIAKNDQIYMMATRANGLALEVGHLSPKMIADPALKTGEIGYIVTNLKTTREAKVGDTVTLKKYM